MSTAEIGLAEFFRRDHRSCDALWGRVEEAADARDREGTARAWPRFEEALLRHLRREEEVLFPAFEERTGMRDAGPTFIMRSEHEQMRGVLRQMHEAVERGNAQELLDQGDTLLMLIQQHNQKEEHMLYPMAEQALGDLWPRLREQLTHDASAP
ncbi:MAG: hemerythrin domain-containing protein [Myxococcota bacterium]